MEDFQGLFLKLAASGMSLREMYEEALSLDVRRKRPHAALADMVAAAAECSPSTVRLWALGHSVPSRLARKAAAECLGVDWEQLFPDLVRMRKTDGPAGPDGGSGGGDA